MKRHIDSDWDERSQWEKQVNLAGYDHIFCKHKTSEYKYVYPRIVIE